MIPTTQCLKVAELRKRYGNDINLRIWMENPANMYVGRKGRIFITVGGESEIFHYPGSVWANPYKLDQTGVPEIVMNGEIEDIKKSRYTTRESLLRYEEYVRRNLWNRLNELDGRTLGCFCKQGEVERCHAQVLVRLWREKNGL